jgi:hypothetical protein
MHRARKRLEGSLPKPQDLSAQWYLKNVSEKVVLMVGFANGLAMILVVEDIISAPVEV